MAVKEDALALLKGEKCVAEEALRRGIGWANASERDALRVLTLTKDTIVEDQLAFPIGARSMCICGSKRDGSDEVKARLRLLLDGCRREGWVAREDRGSREAWQCECV